jgi:hypothetical protein
MMGRHLEEEVRVGFVVFNEHVLSFVVVGTRHP